MQTLPSFACLILMSHKYRHFCIEKHTANSSTRCGHKNIVFTRIFWTSDIRLLKQNVKQSHYRPGQTPRVPAGWDSQISRQSAYEGGKVVSPTHQSPLQPPPHTHTQIFLVLISVTGWVNPRARVLPEGLCQLKNLTIPSGIEPATYRLTAQCLNQLCHRAPHKIIKMQVIKEAKKIKLFSEFCKFKSHKNNCTKNKRKAPTQ